MPGVACWLQSGEFQVWDGIPDHPWNDRFQARHDHWWHGGHRGDRLVADRRSKPGGENHLPWKRELQL